jgi:hypothetical protein
MNKSINQSINSNLGIRGPGPRLDQNHNIQDGQYPSEEGAARNDHVEIGT